jgi:hypothetical protein
MYGIKLIHPDHFNYPHMTEDFDGNDGRRTLMNFSGDNNSRSIAANIPVGHRALVYVINDHKFVWAIEYIGGLEDGQRAALAHGIQPNQLTTKWHIFLPIKLRARVCLENAPTADELFERTGIRFTPNQFTMKYITAADYRKLFEAIRWDQRSEP